MCDTSENTDSLSRKIDDLRTASERREAAWFYYDCFLCGCRVGRLYKENGVDKVEVTQFEGYKFDCETRAVEEVEQEEVRHLEVGKIKNLSRSVLPPRQRDSSGT